MRRLRWWRPVALFVTGCIAIGMLSQARQAQATEGTQLEVGKTIESQLAGGQSQEYRFTLTAGQYARISVEQHTINVEVAVVGPDGKEVFAGDVFGVGTPEAVELIADAAGVYRLRVSASERRAPIGRYDVSLREVET